MRRALPCLICGFFALWVAQATYGQENATEGKKDPVKVEKGEKAPFDGILISQEMFDNALQFGIDLEHKDGIIVKQKETIQVYEEKDIAVAKLQDSVDALGRVVDHYSDLVDDLIKQDKPKFPRFGLYAGAGQHVGLDDSSGFYHAGVFISFGR
jgi:hypothetical protein